jgi:di/tripeptidase
MKDQKLKIPRRQMVDRFLKYVQIDTQSSEESETYEIHRGK